jgi:molybdopterin converting factor small subunit
MNIKLSCGTEALTVSWPENAPPTVAQVLNSVEDGDHLRVAAWRDGLGRLRESLPVFVNGEHIRYRQGLETVLQEGDEIYVIPLIAGG